MYPNTRIELIDQTTIPTLITTPTNAPTFLAACSTDKGDERMITLTLDKWGKMFGKVSFEKHGQAQLQVDRILNNGGKVIFKRIVASDAKLANLILVAKTRKLEVQKTDDEGELLYKKPDGSETTEDEGNTPIMINIAEIQFEAKSLTGLGSIADAATGITAMYEVEPEQVQKVNADNEPLFLTAGGVETTVEEGNTPIMLDGFKEYPIFNLFDIGRGVSNKKIRISPDYAGSKNSDYLQYQLDVIEGNTLMETLYFALDPDKLIAGSNISIKSIVNPVSNQIKADSNSVYVKEFVKEVETITGLTGLMDQDILFGKTKAATAISNITITGEVNLSTVFGISLANGTNGKFASLPPVDQANTTEYELQLTNFFSGVTTNDIYDLDKYKIDAIIDANLPAAVKRAIEGLTNFREDGLFFRDLGIVNTLTQMKAAQAQGSNTKYCSTNHLSYDVIDPYSGKQITVTSGYSLAKLLPLHLINGRNRPLAGEVNSAIIDDAIEGTVNYIPVVTPSVNQKEELGDLRINYACYRDNLFELQTQYTSQTKLTQFSYVNNILAIQEVVKAVRTECPKSRYSFISGPDLEKYKNAVDTVISQYAPNFERLTFEYVQDPAMVANKIFYAAIKVKFKDYSESEYFKIYAID